MTGIVSDNNVHSCLRDTRNWPGFWDWGQFCDAGFGQGLAAPPQLRYNPPIHDQSRDES